jgi:hypothetical protein
MSPTGVIVEYKPFQSLQACALNHCMSPVSLERPQYSIHTPSIPIASLPPEFSVEKIPQGFAAKQLD